MFPPILVEDAKIIYGDNFVAISIYLETIELVIFLCGEMKLRIGGDFSPFCLILDLVKHSSRQ